MIIVQSLVINFFPFKYNENPLIVDQVEGIKRRDELMLHESQENFLVQIFEGKLI
jgi:hypothetical protein